MHRSNRIGFWVLVLLVALGAGWAANQQWPFLGMFLPQGEQGEQQAVVEPSAGPQVGQPQTPVAAKEPSADQPAAEGTEEATRVPEPAPDPSLAAQSEAAPAPAAGPEPATSALAEPTGEDSAPQETVAPEDTVAAVADAPSDDVSAPETEAPLASSTDSGTPKAPPVENPAAEVEVAGATNTVPEVGAPSDADAAAAPSSSDVQEPAPSADHAAVSTAPQATAEVGDPQALAGTEPGTAGSTEGLPEEDVAALLSQAKAGTPPSFDIVRVEPDGRAVIAGRAEPGAEVELRSGDQVIDRVRANRRGDWVAIPGKPLKPGDQKLTLVAMLPGAAAIESIQMVIVAVPESAPTTLPVSSAAVTQPMAVVLPRSGRGTGRILQAPGRLSAGGTLALMTVSYDEFGQMLLSGESPPGVPVRVYVDNQPMALVVGDAKGTWSTALDQALKPGTYTLRLDQLDPKGQTVARIETPITRVSEPPIEGDLQVDYVVVQPGNSLWRIARRLSGRGVDYVYIYDSNQIKIRDPDMIFPGQVFQIPPEFGSAG